MKILGYILVIFAAANFASSFADETKLKFRGAGGIVSTGGSIDISVSEKMLELNKFIETYNDYSSQHKREIKIDKMIAKIKSSAKRVVFRGSGPGKKIYSDYKDSIFYISNPTAFIVEEDEIIQGAMGTGSLVDERGLILTNAHVVENANQVWIYPGSKDASGELVLEEANKYLSIVIAKDEKVDLALLKIVGLSKKIKLIPMANIEDVFPGEVVFAIGHPETYFTWSISNGIVSAIRPNYKWMDKHVATMIQNTAPISGGSSGGPLFNEAGKMIGVNTLTWMEGQNLNFAVAINHAKKMIDNVDISNINTTIDPVSDENITRKFTVLGSGDYNKNGVVDEWYVDKNNNGIPDALFIDEDEDGKIEKIYIDANENEIWDMVIFDDDLDGKPNRQVIDRDEDSKPDVIAYDFDQDGIWDKFEDIKDEG